MSFLLGALAVASVIVVGTLVVGAFAVYFVSSAMKEASSMLFGKPRE